MSRLSAEKWTPRAEQEESDLVVDQPGQEHGDQLQGKSHQIQLVHAEPDTNITAATLQFEPLPSPQVSLRRDERGAAE